MHPVLNKTIAIFIFFTGLVLNTSVSYAEYGDIILNKKADAMRKADVGDVIFPHWFHRIRYRCNVCHEDIFKLEAGSNDISMKIITDDQKMCGKCHNGTIAESPLQCNTCHSLEPGWSGGAIQHSKKNVSSGSNKTIPSTNIMQIGAGQHPLALSESGLPLDKYGLVDWAGAVRQKIVDPIWSLDPKADIKDLKSRDTKILFEAKAFIFPDVIFPHDIHSYWLQCKICHQTKGGAIFKDKTGANKLSMSGISRDKKWCARCHNKVSFPIADCIRCHNHKKGDAIEDGVIIRQLKK